MSKRVAYLVNQYPKASHSFIRREIQALERIGFEVQRIAVRGWDAEISDPEDFVEQQRTRYLLQDGLTTLLIAALRVMFTTPKRFFSALWLSVQTSRLSEKPLVFHLVYFAQACLMLIWIRRFGARHIHAHFGTNSTNVVMLVQALGGPSYSFTVHGPEEFDKPESIALGEKIRRAAFVVAISSFGRSQLFRWVQHTCWSKIQVVHCGLEPAFYDVAASEPPDVQRLVCVGRLCAQKGQLLLLEAASQLVQRGVPLELVLAGDGEMRSQVEALVQEYGLEKTVRITGWISSAQVRTEILEARAMVLPSFAEGLPVVIMESMALRRPVLTTSIAGIPELVQPDANGWLFSAGSVEALAEAMASCLSTPTGKLAEMGNTAFERVLHRHSIDTEVAKLGALFEHSIAASGA